MDQLKAAWPGTETEILPVWGDVLLRAAWQADEGDVHPRIRVLEQPEQRRRLVGDILDELDADILQQSLLYQLITGSWQGLDDRGADIVIDCMNTATAVAYQNIYQAARRLEGRILDSAEDGLAGRSRACVHLSLHPAARTAHADLL